MLQLVKFIERAERSAFWLFILNVALRRIIPFNAPHRFRITQIAIGSVTIKIPYRRRNLNHIKGLHACALATVAEYATGIALLSRLGQDYRIIMRSMQVDYQFQGKMDASASFSISEQEFQQEVVIPLKNADSIDFVAIPIVKDAAGNILCTPAITWQIKSWQKVRLK